MGLAFPEIRQKGWNALIKELGYGGARYCLKNNSFHLLLIQNLP